MASEQFESQEAQTKNPMSREEMMEFLQKQTEEALKSPENAWFAGEKLGHSPSPNEAIMYFIQNGGAENFRRRWDESHNHHSQNKNDQHH